MVYTTADECRDEAREHVKGAIQAISKIVIDEVEGFEDLKESYRDKLKHALNDLLNVREKLENR